VRRFVFAVLVLAACTKQDTPAPRSAAPQASPPVTGMMAAAAVPTALAPTVRFIGRVDASDPSAVQMAWPGTAIVARFKGTTLTAHLKEESGTVGHDFIQVILDGETKQVIELDPKKESYVVAEGLAEGNHDITLYKRTEAKVGTISFLSFEGATLLPAPPASSRRIELIGDSITTGYGNEGPGAACGFTPKEENEYVTYGALVGRMLNAEHHTLAWSGKTIGQMTDYYERTLPTHENSRWDFTSWIPQVVVVNVGTNNFALVDPGEARYVRLYTNLVQRVRKAYPEALIVCALGPMLTDVYPEGHHNLTIARRYMQTAVAKMKETDPKVELLEFPEQKHSDGLGCGFHPSPKTHQLMAERLAALLKEKLGW
jgi:lysophospholipase L1-like esterase